jgi:hypothetical protein
MSSPKLPGTIINLSPAVASHTHCAAVLQEVIIAAESYSIFSLTGHQSNGIESVLGFWSAQLEELGGLMSEKKAKLIIA